MTSSNAKRLPYFTAGPVIYHDRDHVVLACPAHIGPMVKQFSLSPAGNLVKKGHPRVEYYDFSAMPFGNPFEAQIALRKASLIGACFLTEAVIERFADRHGSIRAADHHGSARTLADVERRWVAADIDEVPLPAGVEPSDRDAIADFIRDVGMKESIRGCKFLICASQSMGFARYSDTQWMLKVHLFYWLPHAMRPAASGAWLQENFNWPLDMSFYNAGRLNFVAEPKIVPPLEDPIAIRVWVSTGDGMLLCPPPSDWVAPARSARSYGKGSKRLNLSIERREQIISQPPDHVIKSARPGELHALTISVMTELIKRGESRADVDDLFDVWQQTNSKYKDGTEEGRLEFNEMLQWASLHSQPRQVACPEHLISNSTIEQATTVLKAGLRDATGATLFRVDVGVGKTAESIYDLDTTSNVVLWCVPYHKLADEAADRIRAAGHRAIVWKGIGQPDPDKPERTMCVFHESAQELQALGGGLSILCRDCEHYPRKGEFGIDVCGYHRQSAKAPVVVMAGTPATSALPSRVASGLEDAALEGKKVHVVIDEPDPIAMIKKVEAPKFLPDIDVRLLAGDRLLWAEAKAIIYRFLALTVDVLDADTVADLFNGEPDEEVLKGAHAVLQSALADMLNGTDPLELSSDDRKQVKALLNWTHVINALVQCAEFHNFGSVYRDIEGTWRFNYIPRLTKPFYQSPEPHPLPETVKIDLLDATADHKLLSRFFWRSKKVDTGIVHDGPGVRRTQVWNQTASYTKLTGDKPTQSLIEDYIRLIWCKWREYSGNIGVICYKALRANIEEDLPPINIAHFGALRGIDSFSDVRCLIVIGRPLPPSIECYRLACALIPSTKSEGDPGYCQEEVAYLVRKKDGTYEGRAANRMVSPDPDVERVRASVCDAEVEQALGRARAVRRDCERPVDILIMSGHPTSKRVDSLVTHEKIMSDITPVQVAISKGIAPEDLQDAYGRWAVLDQCFSQDGKRTARYWYESRGLQGDYLRDEIAALKPAVPISVGVDPREVIASNACVDMSEWSADAIVLFEWLKDKGLQVFTAMAARDGCRALRVTSARNAAIKCLADNNVIHRVGRRWVLSAGF